jgi:hypothetical protein
MVQTQHATRLSGAITHDGSSCPPSSDNSVILRILRYIDTSRAWDFDKMVQSLV